MKQNLKKKNGITLIALVVTIVVLLILAATSISMLIGDNGIANRALKAKNEQKISEIKEAVELIRGDYEVENNGENPTSRYIIENLLGNNKISISDVADYGDNTGVGEIIVEGKTILIFGKENKEYSLYVNSWNSTFFLSLYDSDGNYIEITLNNNPKVRLLEIEGQPEVKLEYIEHSDYIITPCYAIDNENVNSVNNGRGYFGTVEAEITVNGKTITCMGTIDTNPSGK